MQKKKKETDRRKTRKKIETGDLVQFRSIGEYMSCDEFSGPFTVYVEPGETGLVLTHRPVESWGNFIFPATAEVLIGSMVIAEVPDKDLKILGNNV